jgi:hypothetical protein
MVGFLVLSRRLADSLTLYPSFPMNLLVKASSIIHMRATFTRFLIHQSEV